MRNQSILSCCLLSLALGLGQLSNAEAGILYGLSHAANPDSLYTIDTTTGASTHFVTLTGDHVSAELSGLEYLNGTFYASNVSNGLISIHATTGATNLLTTLPGGAYGLAGNPTNSLLYFYADAGDQLYSIDPTASSPSPTAVGSPGSVSWLDGLAFDPSGSVMYGISDATNELFTVDLTTGATTAVGGLGLTLSGGIHGLALDPDDGRLYMGSNSILYELNKSTGLATSIGSMGLNFAGLAVIGQLQEPGPSGPSVIPEPSTLLLLLPLLGLFARRRRAA